jgi:hypothetical protein
LKRRLLLLDLALVALIVLAGSVLRRERLAARVREQGVLRQTVKPVPPPPAEVAPPPAPVTAATYLDIAQNMLFSKDRNAVVVVEPPPPPPPKPMPPLPVFYGVMNLGDGPIAILSEKPNQPNRDFRPGEKIGEFTLVAVNTQEIELDWDGKRITRKLDDLVVRAAPVAGPDARRTPAVAPAPPAKPAQAVPSAAGGPGVDVGRGMRACQPNDGTAPGTVVDGLRKVVSDSPFGQVCRWEPVR